VTTTTTIDTDLEWLRGQVRELAATNRQHGHATWSGHNYDFLCPSYGT
jgi:hypothetical protein